MMRETPIITRDVVREAFHALPYSMMFLDTATSTGWAYWDYDAKILHFGTKKFGGKDVCSVGEKLGQLLKWLIAFNRSKSGNDKIKQVAYEQVIKNSLVLKGFESCIHIFSYMEEMNRPVEINHGRYSKLVLGDNYKIGSNCTRDEQKRKIVEKVKELGFQAQGDDEADAICIGICFAINKDYERKIRFSPQVKRVKKPRVSKVKKK